MGFKEWMLIGTAGLFLHSQAKKNRDEQEKEELKHAALTQKLECERATREKEHEDYMKSLQQKSKEAARKRNVDRKRQDMPCFFCDGLTQKNFDTMAHQVATQVTRIKSIRVEHAVVYGTVESQTGLTEWGFKADFNNWGHVTGAYWLSTENDDSAIPEFFGKSLSSLIRDYLKEKRVFVEDYSAVVNDNKTLETLTALDTQYHEKFFQRFFKRGYYTVQLLHPIEHYYGEHLYPVISLIKKYGFTNIKCYPIEDIDATSSCYPYEVAKISIGGMTEFDSDYPFQHNSEVIIHYHDKLKITISVSPNKFRRKNYIEVGNYLQELGFSQIYERKIRDIKTGIITKEGSVASVFIEDGEEIPIVKGTTYLYDQKIIITYHTRK